jgi:hypothetical protein
MHKRGMSYARVIHKKGRRKKELRKNGQVSKLSKQWVLRCPSKKRERDE